MQLQELKQQVYQAWECLSTFNLAVVQPENFKEEVRQQFGDLRRKETWVKALARFTARNCYDACLDAYSLILYDFNFTRDRWDYEYRYLIIEEFLTIPGALELIQLGLEQLFSSTFTPHEREQANGFFELVPAAAVRIGLPVGFVRQLEGTSQARTSRHSDGLQRLPAVYDLIRQSVQKVGEELLLPKLKHSLTAQLMNCMRGRVVKKAIVHLYQKRLRKPTW